MILWGTGCSYGKLTVCSWIVFGLWGHEFYARVNVVSNINILHCFILVEEEKSLDYGKGVFPGSLQLRQFSLLHLNRIINMDKALRPERFEGSANTSTSAKEFNHWIKTLENYISVLPQDNLDKLKLLTNFVSPSVHEYFSDCATYDSAVEALKKVYVKPTNVVFA